MPQNFDYSNNPDPNGELTPSTNTTTEEKPENPLEVFAEVVDNALEAVEKDPTQQWMEITAPFLKSGGKTVAVILALGFVSIPLTLFGSPWIGIILATGATITAVCSSLR